MFAYVRLQLPDGTARDLGHGDLIGRLWSAACPIDDPRVSEAHAMVSLRGSQLKLLALRGRFAVDGAPLTELALAVGQHIALADGLHVDVLEVALPDAVMALEGAALPRQALPAVASVRAGPRPELLAGVVPDADAVLWSDGRSWRWRLRDAPTAGVPFAVGDTLVIGAHALRATEVPLEGAGQAVTVAHGAIGEPLHLQIRYDTAHILRGNAPPVVIDGMSARILAELADMGVPAPWDVIARELWPDEDNPTALRNRWDVAVWRLRKKLRDGRVRPDLVRSDRSGNIELCLARHDTLENRN
jgi:hypothetical protein